MDQREGQVEFVGHRGRALRAAGVRADDHAFLHGAVDFGVRLGRVHQVFTDPFHTVRLCVQVVHGHVEEALDLRRVQVHRDDVVAARRLEHVGHQLRRDGCSGFVFLVLSGVGEVREHRRHSSRRGSLACVANDEEFHQPVVDIVGSSRLEDEDCGISQTPGQLHGISRDHQDSL